MAMAKALRMSDRGLDFFLTLAVDGVKAAIRSPGLPAQRDASALP